MAMLTESGLRRLIKEELRKVLSLNEGLEYNLFQTTPKDVIAALTQSKENNAVLQELNKHANLPVVTVVPTDSTISKFVISLGNDKDTREFNKTGNSSIGNVETIGGKGFFSRNTVQLIKGGREYLAQNPGR